MRAIGKTSTQDQVERELTSAQDTAATGGNQSSWPRLHSSAVSSARLASMRADSPMSAPALFSPVYEHLNFTASFL